MAPDDLSRHLWEGAVRDVATAAAGENKKVRENRVRRIAERRGYLIEKSRRRDPAAVEYDRWTLQTRTPGDTFTARDLDVRSKILDVCRDKCLDGRRWLTLDEAEAFLALLRDQEEVAAVRAERNER